MIKVLIMAIIYGFVMAIINLFISAIIEHRMKQGKAKIIAWIKKYILKVQSPSAKLYGEDYMYDVLKKSK